jgi:chorismate-pyruvate lyase
LPAARLSPFHRNILVTDGTVTRTLEAFTLEPIEAVCLEQYPATLADSGHHADGGEWLDAPAHEPVLVRRVELVGAHTRIRYVRAVSLIAPNQLPESFHAALATESAGIGAALQAAAAESHRQLLYYGRPPGTICARRYRVFVRSRPAMVIGEWFLR